VGILKGYDEDTAVVQIGLDDRDLELPVKEIALIRKMVEF
jgi:hypothetical protein